MPSEYSFGRTPPLTKTSSSIDDWSNIREFFSRLLLTVPKPWLNGFFCVDLDVGFVVGMMRLVIGFPCSSDIHICVGIGNVPANRRSGIPILDSTKVILIRKPSARSILYNGFASLLTFASGVRSYSPVIGFLHSASSGSPCQLHVITCANSRIQLVSACKSELRLESSRNPGQVKKSYSMGWAAKNW